MRKTFDELFRFSHDLFRKDVDRERFSVPFWVHQVRDPPVGNRTAPDRAQLQPGAGRRGWNAQRPPVGAFPLLSRRNGVDRRRGVREPRTLHMVQCHLHRERLDFVVQTENEDGGNGEEERGRDR